MADAGQKNDSHLGQILAIQTLVVVIAVVCVALRLYVRMRLIKSIGGDDWTMGGAAVRSFLFLSHVVDVSVCTLYVYTVGKKIVFKSMLTWHHSPVPGMCDRSMDSLYL